MATFKVNQRVKIVGAASRDEEFNRGVIGREGVIVGRSTKPYHFPWVVEYDGAPIGMNDFGVGRAAFRSQDLVPLTDPHADAWATDAVRKVTKPLHVEPVVAPKVKA